MANFGTHLAYPAPERPAAARSTTAAAHPVPAAATSATGPHGARPGALRRAATGARRGLRALAQLWLEGSVRPAGGPAIPGWPAPSAQAWPDRRVRQEPFAWPDRRAPRGGFAWGGAAASAFGGRGYPEAGTP